MNNDTAPGALLRLDREGRWWFQGRLVANPRVQTLFHQGLTRTREEDWALVVGHDRADVRVEDVPLFIQRIQTVAEPDIISGWCLDGACYDFDASTLQWRAKQGDFVLRRRQDGWRARVLSSAVGDLSDLLEESPDGEALLRIGARVFPVTTQDE